MCKKAKLECGVLRALWGARAGCTLYPSCRRLAGDTGQAPIEKRMLLEYSVKNRSFVSERRDVGWQWKWERFQDGQPRYGGSPATSHSQTRVVWKGNQMAAEIAVQLSSRQPRKLWERPKRGRRSFREERFEGARTVVAHPPSCFEPASALGST